MKTSIKHVSDTRVELTISLTTDELQDAELVALGKLAKKVKVPGFRQGHVPPSVAAKHVDPRVLTEQTLDDALSKAVAKAFTDEKIQALDRPEVDVTKYVPGEVLDFTATVDVIPPVKLGDYKKLGVKKEAAKVDAKEVDEIIERMRKGLAEKVAVKRAAKLGDEVVIDFVGKKDGVAFEGGASKDYKLELGSNSFIPGFEDGIVGHKVGEEFELELAFPEDYHAPTLKGAKVVFEVKLNEVLEAKLPTIDDEFAAKTGPYKTVAEMKAGIKSEIATKKEFDTLTKYKDELIEKLIAVSKAPAPEVLIQDQMKSIEQDMVQNLAYQGLSLQNLLDDRKLTREEWLEKDVREAATQRIQASLVLNEVSKAEKIEATSEELAAKINEFQERYGNKSDTDFTSPEIQRDIANRLLTDKTIDRLVELNAK